MKNNLFDVLIIGGGAAGSSAASVCVKKGLKVAMVDGGYESSHQINAGSDFEDFRSTFTDQSKLFLGEDLSGIVLNGQSHSSSQTQGKNKHLVQGVNKMLALKTDNVSVLQTLAKGGLAEIWGANCDFFSQSELGSAGIETNLDRYYQQVIDEIGVSGAGSPFKLQPPFSIDHNGKAIVLNYRKKKADFQRNGLKIHAPFLAMLTRDKKLRKKTSYQDMDYWSEGNKSMYKPRYTIEELEKKRNFAYFKDVAASVKETKTGVQVIAKNRSYFTKFVILTPGPLSTLRILVKSFNLYNIKFPFLTKYHIISAGLLLSNLGKAGDRKKHSLCQVIMEGTNSKIRDYSYTQFYSYKSLLLYKLANFSPLPVPDFLSILSLISSALVLADTRIGSNLEDGGYCLLEKKAGQDIARVVYKKQDPSQVKNSQLFNKVKKGIKQLGILPLSHTYMPYGSTAHYAGTLAAPKSVIKLKNNNSLDRSDKIYVADSSSWQSLPAKPPTLTIMANARRIAENLIKDHF